MCLFQVGEHLGQVVETMTLLRGVQGEAGQHRAVAAARGKELQDAGSCNPIVRHIGVQRRAALESVPLRAFNQGCGKEKMDVLLHPPNTPLFGESICAISLIRMEDNFFQDCW